jgi:hypothetical protein
MGLNWSVRNVPNHETVCWDADGRLSRTTNALIWACLVIGIREITKKNVDEFTRRMTAWETKHGPARVDANGTPVQFTREEIAAHVGLHTNATPIAKRAFDARMK